jgi:hypothetical protein
MTEAFLSCCISSCLVTVKRYGEEEYQGDFARKIPSQTVIKGAAAARGADDNDTTVVGAFMIYNTAPPSNCMRNAYYRRIPHVVERKRS